MFVTKGKQAEQLPESASDIEAPDHHTLSAWYRKTAQRHQGSLSAINGYIIFYFIVQGIVFISTVPYAGTIDGGTGTIIFLSVILYIWMLTKYVFDRSENLLDTISWCKYVRLKEDQFPDIWNISYSLMGKMGLRHYTLVMYYAKKDAINASVMLEGNTVYLVLTRGLTTIHRDRPKDVESILAHEFGHVYQGDTRMLYVNRRSIQIPAIIGTVLVIVNIIIALCLWLKGQPLEIPKVTPSSILILHYWHLVYLRKEAEYLSDMASMIFVQESSLPEIIEKYFPDHATFNYPSSSQRIRFIELITKKKYPKKLPDAIQEES